MTSRTPKHEVRQYSILKLDIKGRRGSWCLTSQKLLGNKYRNRTVLFHSKLLTSEITPHCPLMRLLKLPSSVAIQSMVKAGGIEEGKGCERESKREHQRYERM